LKSILNIKLYILNNNNKEYIIRLIIDFSYSQMNPFAALQVSDDED